MKWFLWFSLVSLFSGCTPRGDLSRDQQVVLREERECVLTILVDLSGSFQEKMLEDGKAYGFCLDAIDTYFRDRIGEKDELVIGQISGTKRALLWQGTPMQLRRDFPNPKALNDFLRKNAVPSGSNVYESLAQSVEYVTSDPDVASGKAKSAVIVLSDMVDTGPDQVASRQHLRKALAEYSKHGGVIGCYFVDQTLVADCRDFIKSTGIRNAVVESEIVGNPQLPVLE